MNNLLTKSVSLNCINGNCVYLRRNNLIKYSKKHSMDMVYCYKYSDMFLYEIISGL